MSETSTEAEHEETSANWKLSALFSVLILSIAGGLAALTFFTEPTAKKGGATKKTAMLVEVMDVERGNFRPTIVAQGTVVPSQDIVLRPQVSGRVTSLSPAFTPGSHVEEGERLMRIESADFEHTLAQRKSELQQALTELAVEEGRHEAAKAEYSYLDEKLADQNEALVLRKPQLEAARERVNAARAAVEQARLDVRRTTVEAPFDAHILTRQVNVGSQVSPSDTLGRLVGIDSYWVGVEIPLSKLRWVAVADEDAEGSEVRVRNPQAWPEDAYRAGHIFKLVGALDQDTRMARVLASIPDPTAREADSKDKPPLMLDEFVEVSIRGVELEDVVRLNRDYMREDDTVWVMRDGELQVVGADVVLRDAKYAYISGGIEDGAKIVTTNISTVVEGAPLRLNGAQEEAADEEAPGE